MPKKRKIKKRKAKRRDDSHTYAFITTFFSIFGFILAMLLWKKNKYVIFYAKQSLVIFVIAIIASVVNSILNFIPIFGWVITFGLNIVVLIAWLASWINSLSGKTKSIPIVSDYTKKINL